MRALGFLLLFGFLVGCGFEPVSEESKNQKSLVGVIKFAEPSVENEYYLRGFFDEIFGLPVHVRYLASYALKITETEQSISESADISRHTYAGTLSVTVSDYSGHLLEVITVENFMSYNSSVSMFRRDAEAADARLRLIRSLADYAAIRMMMASASWSK